ncbi:hypothetical protein PoB_004971300 [Plakobranchus ocellatus]|uniref:Uncharacterized protein n=1 Tax=Plakobranchus ocellatus TaxID=259542 RepID=A0AAV4BVG5_9GAST|nr:hypothetical protein PoB_004971300 [Plakobranchus ocellatus]
MKNESATTPPPHLLQFAVSYGRSAKTSQPGKSPNFYWRSNRLPPHARASSRTVMPGVTVILEMSGAPGSLPSLGACHLLPRCCSPNFPVIWLTDCSYFILSTVPVVSLYGPML